MCVYNIKFMKAGIIMNYTLKKTAENVAVMETENGCSVTIVFKKEDNPDIEDIVTNNLMMSYEQRMREKKFS